MILRESQGPGKLPVARVESRRRHRDRGLPGTQLLELGTGQGNLERDRVFEPGLEAKVMHLAADGPLEQEGDLAARERLCDSLLRPGPGKDGAEEQAVVDRVVI